MATAVKTSLAVTCAAAALAAQQAPSHPATFKVGVDIVSIDAVVTDRQGRVVRDLTAADFDVLQDGKRQKVTLAQFVPVAAPAAPTAGTIAPAANPPRRPTTAPAVPAASSVAARPASAARRANRVSMRPIDAGTGPPIPAHDES